MIIIDGFKNAFLKLLLWIIDVKKNCYKCDENGMVECSCSATRMIICDQCKGKKEIIKKDIKKVLSNDGNCEECINGFIICPNCKGKVLKDESGEEVYCLVCDNKRKIKCPTCKGTGAKTIEIEEEVQSWVKCEKCYGQGEIRCTKCNEQHKVICPTCHGKKIYIDWFKIGTTIFVVYLVVRYIYLKVNGYL